MWIFRAEGPASAESRCPVFYSGLSFFTFKFLSLAIRQIRPRLMVN